MRMIGSILDEGKWGYGKSVIGEEAFFAEAVLGDFEDAVAWSDGCPCFGFADGEEIDIFEFESDDIDGLGEVANGIAIFVGSDEGLMSSVACGCILFGGEDVHTIAESEGDEGEHASELASAEDADGLAWKDAR